MTKMTLPMAGMPAVIAEAVQLTLAAHGYVIARRVQHDKPDGTSFVEDVGLDDDTLAALLRECGNNTTQALFALDEPRYELGYASTFALRRAFLEHKVTDDDLLGAIIRLEHGEGTSADIADLCHLAELAGLQWRDLFPDVFESQAPPPSDAAVSERDGADDSPLTVPSRSGCTVHSSVTEQPCALDEGHEADSPTRFHRYDGVRS